MQLDNYKFSAVQLFSMNFTVEKCDGQKQTSNFLLFAPPSGGMKSQSPTILGMVTEEVVLFLYLNMQRIVLPLWGSENLEEKAPPWLNRHKPGTLE